MLGFSILAFSLNKSMGILARASDKRRQTRVLSRSVYSIDCLKEPARKHGTTTVINLIPSCLRGSALIWWTVEVDDIAKELVEDSRKLAS